MENSIKQFCFNQLAELTVEIDKEFCSNPAYLKTVQLVNGKEKPVEFKFQRVADVIATLKDYARDICLKPEGTKSKYRTIGEALFSTDATGEELLALFRALEKVFSVEGLGRSEYCWRKKIDSTNKSTMEIFRSSIPTDRAEWLSLLVTTAHLQIALQSRSLFNPYIAKIYSEVHLLDTISRMKWLLGGLTEPDDPRLLRIIDDYREIIRAWDKREQGIKEKKRHGASLSGQHANREKINRAKMFCEEYDWKIDPDNDYMEYADWLEAHNFKPFEKKTLIKHLTLATDEHKQEVKDFVESLKVLSKKQH